MSECVPCELGRADVHFPVGDKDGAAIHSGLIGEKHSVMDGHGVSLGGHVDSPALPESPQTVSIAKGIRHLHFISNAPSKPAQAFPSSEASSLDGSHVKRWCVLLSRK